MPTPTSMNDNPTKNLAIGDRVRLHGLNKRSELNDAMGRVLEFFPDAQRFRVELASGECIRVRAANLSAVTTSDSDARAKAAHEDVANPPAPPTATDATLYVANGRFFAPGVPAPPMVAEGSSSTERGTQHTLRLPAGHWEVRTVEQAADVRQATVTLVAVEECGQESACWAELKGITITRTVQASDRGDDIMSPELAAVVDGCILKIFVPWAAPVDSRPPEDTSSRSLAHAEAAMLDWETSASEASTEVAAQELLSDDLLDSDSPHSTAFAFATKKNKALRERRPLFARRSLSLGMPAARQCHSRRLAQARRRAVSARSDAIRGAHSKARTDPLWKKNRARVTADAEGA